MRDILTKFLKDSTKSSPQTARTSSVNIFDIRSDNSTTTDPRNQTEKQEATYDNAGGPWVEQKDGTDEEGGCQYHADEEQQPVAKTYILLPEEERVAVGVAGHSLPTVIVADGTDALDSLHKLWRLT